MYLVKKIICSVKLAFMILLNNWVLVVLVVTLQYPDRKNFQFQKIKGILVKIWLCNVNIVKFRKEFELFKQVQQHCLDFFMELVSQCCFSQIAEENPSEEFFKALLEIVTDTEDEEYKHLFPFEEEYAYSCPIARSVLLQLLLEHK